jgi:mannosyltransferase OCH1-like enzyme
MKKIKYNIPKIIHQTWKDLEIPDKWNYASKSCKNINNGYVHILWTDEMMEKFTKKVFPDFYPVYMSYEYHIQRCDVFRYLVLYIYGGIYLDLDIGCKKSFDNLLNYDLIVTKSYDVTACYINSFFMVKPRHPFIGFCINNLSDYINSHSTFGKHLHVMNSTGPFYLTNMLHKYNLSNINNLYIMPKNEFSGDCNTCNENKCNGGVYFTHLVGRSWFSFDSYFYNFCFCNKNIIFFILIIIIILLYNKKIINYQYII